MAQSKIEHVLVLTEDIDATRDFYRDVLGLEVGERPPLEFPGYWLYSDAGPCVHVAERAAYEEHSERIGIPASRGPVEHVAFDAPDYDAVAERIEQGGIPALRNAVPGVMRQLFVEDPNGVKIEINVKER
jgi:catechol 2,3-dioxygenase-like lactoylglutathione lyase family enzyme